MLIFSFCLGSDSECWSIEPQKGLGNEAGFQCSKSVAEIVNLL